MSTSERKRLAVIGTGIAGMGAAHFLHDRYDLTVYEKNDYIGGHTNTVDVDEDGRTIPVDTGFIVFNDVTYPNLCRLFDELKVDYKKTDMSFGVQHIPTNLEYAAGNNRRGGVSLKKLFAQPRNMVNLRFIRMLLQLNRFNNEAVKLIEDPAYANCSMREFVDRRGYGEDFLEKYLSPMSSALWSTAPDVTLQFPALSLMRFFRNHGLLGTDTQYQWYTVTDGSRQYRDKLIAPFKDRVMVRRGAKRVIREDDGVTVIDTRGEKAQYDYVVMACHADQALALLKNPARRQRQLLKHFDYQTNSAILHTDESVMPKKKAAWASWNYRIEYIKDGKVAHTIYWMNSLQQVSKRKNYFVSINDPGKIDERKIITEITYEHPIFTVDAMKAQEHLHELNADPDRVYFCGSYFKYGFHEDAFASAVEMCRYLTKDEIWGKYAEGLEPKQEEKQDRGFYKRIMA